jgi:ATP-dependent helicase Lhr and Lhr-like helicase
MRALRERPEKPEAVLLATTDPAQPYGVQLPWPATRLGSGKPRRAVGSYVVLVDGRPCLFVDRGGERVLCFETDLGDGGDAEIGIARAARCLTRSLARMGKARISVEEIDGERARRSSLADIFVSAGFRAGYRGLEIDRVVETFADHD